MRASTTQASSQASTALRHPGLIEFALLLLLALVWGSSFLFIKIAVSNGMPPLTLAANRIFIGAVVLISVARLRGQAWPGRAANPQQPGGAGLWLRLVFLGIIGNSLPFFLIGWGEQFTASQLAAILMATIPLLVLIIAHVMTHDEKLTGAKVIGVICDFAGVVVLVGFDALRGLGAQVIRADRHHRRLPQLFLLRRQCAAPAADGCRNDRRHHLRPGLPLHPAGLALCRPPLGPRSFGQRAFCRLVAWPALDRLRQLAVLHSDAPLRLSFASNNNFLVPVMGLGWGFFGYGEVPGINALVALVLILVGLALPRFRRL